MAESRVRIVRGSGCRVCRLVASVIEEVLCSAARLGMDVPDEVVVEAYDSPGMLEPRLELEARSVGASYAGVRPESCVLYTGWTGLPQVYVVTPLCEGMGEARVKGEAVRAAAHSILHRSVECYVYAVNPYYEATLRMILGPLAPVFLYLVGAGVRGYEANSLAVRLDYGGYVAVDEEAALREAVAALEKPSLRVSRLLMTAEIFKYFAEAKPLTGIRPGIIELLQRVTVLYPIESRAAAKALASLDAGRSTAERARAAAESIIAEILAHA